MAEYIIRLYHEDYPGGNNFTVTGDDDIELLKEKGWVAKPAPAPKVETKPKKRRKK